MNHKDFLNEVQKTCHADQHLCATLLGALQKLMLQAAIDQIPVTVQGLGTFTSYKHPEYIQEDEQTGEQTLFPPRISYRMQAVSTSQQNTTSDQGVTSELAEYVQMPYETVAAFLQALAQVITSHVSNHEEVEVHSLGTFHRVEAHQAELQRIAFTPDEQMKEQVNAPFSCFEPVVIREGRKVETPSAFVAAEQDEMAVPAPVEEIVIPGIETAPQEEIVAEPIVEESAPQVLTSEQPVEVSEPEQSVEKSESKQQIVEEPEPVATTVVAVQPKPEEPKTRMEPEDKNKKSGNTFLYTTIGVILVACVVFVIYLYVLDSGSERYVVAELAEPEEELIVAEEVADTIIAPIEEQIPSEEIVVKTLPEVKNQPVEQKAEPKEFHRLMGADGQPVTVTLNPGERLTIVALNQYGDKAFWPYIFDVNSDRLKAPNLVQAGMKLYLPDPAFYDIDANDEASLRKAKNRGAQLLKE